jgi:hypothetical protein
MIALLLATTLAWSQEAPIQYVPEGRTVEATVPSYLLPEPKYDACLIKARELIVVDGKLSECLGGCEETLGTAQDALSTCETRMLDDARELATLRATLEVREARIVELRRQRNTAAAITAGVLALGFGGFALAVAL